MPEIVLSYSHGLMKGMFPIRLLSPLVAIGIAGYYFLPETTGNILALAKRLEAKGPVIWETHQKLNSNIDELKQETLLQVERVGDKLGITKK